MEQTLQPGDRVSDYEVQALVGQGTFSRVYAVRDLSDADRPQRALLELITRGDAEEQRLRQRTFERAARVLEKVSDPAIPQIYRFFQEGDRSYIAQEFIDGSDYGEYIDERQSPLSPAEAERVLQETLSGLAQLHAAKIVHRDIKPGNLVRRAADGSTVIVDFGSACDLSQVAAAATQMPGLTKESGHTQIYTPGYAHPDQREGLAMASPQWDLYALAKTIVALRLGSNPPWHQPWAIEGLGLSPKVQGLLREMLKSEGCSLLDARDALTYEPPAIPTVPVSRENLPRQKSARSESAGWLQWLAIFTGAGLVTAAATGGLLYLLRDRQPTVAADPIANQCPTYTTGSNDSVEPTNGFAVRFQYPEKASLGSSTLEIRRDGRLLARANDTQTLGFIQLEALANGAPFPAGQYQLKLIVPDSEALEEEVTLNANSVAYLGKSSPLTITCSSDS